MKAYKVLCHDRLGPIVYLNNKINLITDIMNLSLPLRICPKNITKGTQGKRLDFVSIFCKTHTSLLINTHN